jgi:hypothetical protein
MSPRSRVGKGVAGFCEGTMGAFSDTGVPHVRLPLAGADGFAISLSRGSGPEGAYHATARERCGALYEETAMQTTSLSARAKLWAGLTLAVAVAASGAVAIANAESGTPIHFNRRRRVV